MEAGQGFMMEKEPVVLVSSTEAMHWRECLGLQTLHRVLCQIEVDSNARWKLSACLSVLCTEASVGT